MVDVLWLFVVIFVVIIISFNFDGLLEVVWSVVLIRAWDFIRFILVFIRNDCRERLVVFVMGVG